MQIRALGVPAGVRPAAAFMTVGPVSAAAAGL